MCGHLIAFILSSKPAVKGPAASGAKGIKGKNAKAKPEENEDVLER